MRGRKAYDRVRTAGALADAASRGMPLFTRGHSRRGSSPRTDLSGEKTKHSRANSPWQLTSVARLLNPSTGSDRGGKMANETHGTPARVKLSAKVHAPVLF